METSRRDGTVIARRNTGQVFNVGSGACAFASEGTASERRFLSGARMRARKLIRVFVFTVASLASAASVADSKSAPYGVITVADAAPIKLSSTAMPQSLRSPSFNSHLEFSPQAELTYSGPVSLMAPPRSDGQTVAIPAQVVAERSPADSLLLALLGISLIAYQLFRKHRLLRPQPFSL